MNGTALSLPSLAAAVLSTTSFSFAASLDRLRRLLRDSACSAPLIAEFAISDPMLSAAILSRANAARGSGQVEMTDLSQVISWMGLSVVEGLIIAARPIEDAHRQDLAQAWTQANAVSALARHLAEAARRQGAPLDPILAALAGLTHDLGAIVARRRFPAAYAMASNQAADGRVGFNRALRGALGLDPSGLGALFGRAWALPGPILACLRWHARPTKATEHRELVAVIHIAHVLAAGWGFCRPGSSFVPMIDPDAIDQAKLRLADLEESARRFADQAGEIALFEGVFTA